ncbi:hypothetical protein V5O48_009215 [Marasmius crinis-equi]|uniref:Biotrophy-associated secreted protein 2 n=1 Tax=Marasmius crinis-equi TaxID=585013 RepID=A0ABR3FBQ1_9AGAR
MARFSLVFALLAINLVSAAVVRRQGTGTQFITGPCDTDADCGSGCCGFNTGKCAGAVVALERDGGCGHGNPSPNDDAARKLRGQPPRDPNDPFIPPGGNSNAGGNNGAQNNGTQNNGTQNNGGAAGGAAGSGKAPGTQFITGPCANDGECQSGCCGFNTGKCAGAIVAQERDGGCGFGNAAPNDDAAQKLRGQAPAAAAPANTNTNTSTDTGATNNAGSGANNGGAAGSGKPAGTQFITGPCANDGECQSGCCGFNTGKCAGAIVAQERDGGCGFGNATPNDDAARKLRGQSPASASSAAAPPASSAAAPPANTGAAGTNNGGSGSAAGSGKPAGTQFITGPCANDGECNSGCCGFNTGKCAGAIVAQERDGGCGFGNATPNDDAAKKLRGQA